VPGTLEQGALLNERYRLQRRLGGPEPGTVFLALDLKLNEELLLKVLDLDDGNDKQARELLYKEVNLARLVGHPNVARIYDVTAWQGKELVFMEQIRGQTLERRLAEQRAFSLEEGKALLLDLCAGLGAIHAAGLVHRALKPSNLLLGADSGAIILELGVSGWCPARREGGYLAPEQLAGGQLDSHVDIYALGAVARRIFADEGDLAILRTDLPPLLLALIRRCLAQSPLQRVGTVRDIVPLLQRPAVMKEAG
jgi:serine/threonine-protein kinase